jgi:hypothetical protein
VSALHLRFNGEQPFCRLFDVVACNADLPDRRPGIDEVELFCAVSEKTGRKFFGRQSADRGPSSEYNVAILESEYAIALSRSARCSAGKCTP